MNEEGKSNYYAIIPEEESLYRTGWIIKSLKAGKWCRVHHFPAFRDFIFIENWIFFWIYVVTKKSIYVIIKNEKRNYI